MRRMMLVMVGLFLLSAWLAGPVSAAPPAANGPAAATITLNQDDPNFFHNVGKLILDSLARDSWTPHVTGGGTFSISRGNVRITAIKGDSAIVQVDAACIEDSLPKEHQLSITDRVNAMKARHMDGLQRKLKIDAAKNIRLSFAGTASAPASSLPAGWRIETTMKYPPRSGQGLNTNGVCASCGSCAGCTSAGCCPAGGGNSGCGCASSCGGCGQVMVHHHHRRWVFRGRCR